MARLDEATRTLELGTVRSGDAVFSGVRVLLASDGTYRVLDAGRPAASSRGATDAVLRPALSQQDFQSGARPALLAVPRLHIGAGVLHSLEVELAAGRWRYTGYPRRSTALVADDFRINPQLAASQDHLLVLASAPGVSSSARMRLETRSYELCMPAQSEGADQLALVAPDGTVALQLRAGQPCATYAARAGVYEWRHTYGGLGSSRTMFLGRAQPAPRQRSQRAQRALRQAAGVEEYWALLASWTTGSGAKVQAFLSTVASGNPPDNCFGGVSAFVQADAPTGAGQNALVSYAPVLIDGLNFFRVQYDASGNPASLGPALTCAGSLFGYEPDLDATGPYVLPNGVGFAPRPLRIAPESPSPGPSFFEITTDVSGVNGVLGVPLPYLGFPNGTGLSQDSGMQPVFNTGQIADFQRVLRYRPQGFGPTEAVPEGWVAMFAANDCSGPALIVESPGVSGDGKDGLPGLLWGGSMGRFDGSMRLGQLTTATLYEQVRYGGESHLVNQAGCISQAQGWGTSGWKAASLALQTNPVRLVMQENACIGCNLAGVDFTAFPVAGLDLTGSDLSGANFTSTDLSNATLRDAQLYGAALDEANLYGANLCRASLNAMPSVAGQSYVAASLRGANLHNANLNLAHLENVNFDNANFYGDFQGACSTDCSMNGCASASGAFINDAKFPGAFMSYVDFSGVQGPATFTDAVLVGALFTGANLLPDSNNSTSFNGAYLMGADFSNASVGPDMFTGAYWDNASSSCWSFVLPQPNLLFPSVPTMVTSTTSGGTSYKCTTSTAVLTSTCVPVTYQPPGTAQPAPLAGPAQLPVGFGSNGNCAATPPLCGLDVNGAPGTQGYANQCWGPIPPLPPTTSAAVRRALPDPSRRNHAQQASSQR